MGEESEELNFPIDVFLATLLKEMNRVIKACVILLEGIVVVIKKACGETILNKLEIEVLRKQKNPENVVSFCKKQCITGLLKYHLSFNRNCGRG